MRRATIISLLFLLAVSCRPQVGVWGDAIPFVKEIISNVSSPWRPILYEVTQPSPSGEICIIGSEDACIQLAERLAGMDARDNVDGSYRPDGLPDFAGETFTCLIDTTGFRAKMLNASRNGDDEAVREMTVRYALNAIDTVCHITPYDVIGLGHKNRAKVIILADPELSVFGKQNVDSLFAAFDVRVHVLSPLGEMLENVMDNASLRDANVGIICDESNSDAAIYSRCFNAAKRHAGADEAQCTILSRSDNDSTLVNMLNSYMAAGFTRPFDALLSDSFSLDSEDMKNEIAQTISLMNEESLVYGKLFSKDFRFLNSSDVVAARCYDVLRKDNTFTHYISKPEIAVYYAHPDPEGSGYCYFVPGNYVQN